MFPIDLTAIWQWFLAGLYSLGVAAGVVIVVLWILGACS